MLHKLSAMLLLLLVTASGSLNAQEMRSDYQVQKGFREEVKTINRQLEQAQSPAEARSLQERIEQLTTDYSAYDELINRAIYPETFNETIASLETRAKKVRQQLVTIRRQTEQLAILNEKLSGYSLRLNRLTDRTDSLQSVVRVTNRKEEELSSQLSRFRDQMKERDRLILSFIDSVAMAYNNLGVEEIGQLESAATRQRLNTRDNPLELVRMISSENLELINSGSALSTEDYLRMSVVHREFTNMWDKVGSDLSRVYSDNPEQTREEIDSKIAAWDEKLDPRIWGSLQAAFRQSGVDIGTPASGEALYDSLNTYLDRGITLSQNNGERAHRRYEEFSRFWNSTVKSQWSEYLNRSGILSSAQMAGIDQKVNRWASISEPESPLMAYLLGGSVFAIALLGFMLIREKSGSSESKEDKKSG